MDGRTYHDVIIVVGERIDCLKLTKLLLDYIQHLVGG